MRLQKQAHKYMSPLMPFQRQVRTQPQKTNYLIFALIELRTSLRSCQDLSFTDYFLDGGKEKILAERWTGDTFGA